MTNLHLHHRINDAVAANKMKSTESIIAIILTKEGKAQFDDEVRTITNSEDPQDVKSY
jgi:hypothetical protein